MEYSIKISEKLYKDLSSYCDINNIDVKNFCENAIKKELINQKYGDIPFGIIDEPKDKQVIEQESIPITPISKESTPITQIDQSSSPINEMPVEIVEQEKKKNNKNTNNNKKRRL